ncbi:Sterol uptake control protein 2 like [Verticillium longisporum]|uniref:Sterol uptake control protein 2 like n=1 Tax=Verticillium longisporum TaxID=100787 RepID=A0A8I2Z8U2_VERLO|nr:Sterol uptake control protein 2 like [Verticillium longisporum]
MSTSPDSDPDPPALLASDGTAKPYHSKRPHKKTRSGCKTCKARKVKCDEGRPACRNCVLRKVDCLYPVTPASAKSATLKRTITPRTPTSEPSTSLVASPETSRRPWDPSPIIEPLYIPPGQHDALDMKLLWFYTTNTFNSFLTPRDKGERVNEILRVKIPSYAFENRFLMDCLLGLSALQLENLNQEVDPSRALYYRSCAFEGYRKAIEKADVDTFPALIACSLLLVALSSQMFREVTTKRLHILDWMVVWRGIGLMIRLASPRKALGAGLAELFFRPPIDLNSSSLHIPNNLLFMVSTIRDDDPDHAHVDTYYHCLQYLGSLYQELRQGLSSILNIRAMTWFTFVPPDFVELAKLRRPRALVIIAHYAMFVKVVDTIWWLRGVGDTSIRDILEHLDRDASDHAWDDLLATPRAALRTDRPVDTAKVILNDPVWLPPATDDALCPEEASRLPLMLSLVSQRGKLMRYDSASGRHVELDDGPVLDVATNIQSYICGNHLRKADPSLATHDGTEDFEDGPFAVFQRIPLR